MKRTIIAVLLIVATLSFSTTAFAVDNVGIQKNSCREDMSAKVMLSATRISHIEDNTVLFLSESGINASLIPVCCLYNADDDIEALLYTISGGGYIVVSYKDGHVIEYSLNDLPFDIKDVNPDNRIYYGGPLFFYQKDEANNCFTDLSAAENFVLPDAYPSYSLPFKNDIAISTVDSENTTLPQGATFSLAAPVNYVAAIGNNYCTITGITNLLQYYKDRRGADVYSGSVSTASGLRSTLDSSHYIYNGPLTLNDAAGVHTKNGVTCSGLQIYLYRSDVTTFTVSTSLITEAKVKSHVRTAPVLLTIYTRGIDSSASSSSTHIVLCYGYQERESPPVSSINQDASAYSTTTYYLVNNGWGSNGVYVSASDIGTGSVFRMMWLS